MDRRAYDKSAIIHPLHVSNGRVIWAEEQFGVSVGHVSDAAGGETEGNNETVGLCSGIQFGELIENWETSHDFIHDGALASGGNIVTGNIHIS